MNWQAAASMPLSLRDGRDVLLWANRAFIGVWDKDRWLTTERDEIDGGGFYLSTAEVRFYEEMAPPGPQPRSDDGR